MIYRVRNQPFRGIESIISPWKIHLELVNLCELKNKERIGTCHGYPNIITRKEQIKQLVISIVKRV